METSTSDYTIDIDDLKETKVILQYEDVRVYEAIWRHQIVCVKELSSNISKKDIISNELKILSKCIHPKIVQFLGANISSNKVNIILEYMELGTLKDYLSENIIDDVKKIHIILDIAIGLNYLHNRTPNIVLHRDLKPENILINKYQQIKISDFGISKIVDNKELTGHTGETGSYVWMAPETLKHEPYNYKADIYSFGLIIYYVFTLSIPFSDTGMNTIQMMFAKFKNDLKISSTNNEFVDNLIIRCCNYESQSRPDTDDIIHSIKQFLHDKK